MMTVTLQDSGASDARVLARARGEYREMPGLSPTADQMARLLGVSTDECRCVLTTLVDEGFLQRTSDGRYRSACPRGCCQHA